MSDVAKSDSLWGAPLIETFPDCVQVVTMGRGECKSFFDFIVLYVYCTNKSLQIGAIQLI